MADGSTSQRKKRFLAEQTMKEHVKQKKNGTVYLESTSRGG